METPRIDPIALLVAAAAGGFALSAAPASFGYLSTVEGVTLLLVLFAYDTQGYRSGFQSLAFSAVAAVCLALAGAYALQTLAAPGSSFPLWLAAVWIGATAILCGIDRARMAGRAEAWPSPAGRSAGQSFLSQTPAPVYPVAAQSPVAVSAPQAVSFAPPQAPEPAAVPEVVTFSEPAPEPAVQAPSIPVAPSVPVAASVPIPRSGKEVTIFVNLVGEAMSVMRAVRAEHAGRDFYLIVDEMPENENWEFKPGQLVRCKKKNLSNGKGLVAFEEAPRAN